MKSQEEELQQAFIDALTNNDKLKMAYVLNKMTVQQRGHITTLFKKYNLKNDLEAKIAKDLKDNSKVIPSKFETLIKAIKEGNLKSVTELITKSFTPEELVARDISIGAPIKLAAVSGKVEIVQLLMQRNPKLLSIDNIISKQDQQAEIVKGNNPTNIKVDIFYKGCSDEMLKTLIEFDSTPVELLIENNKHQAVLETIALNPRVLRVLIEEEKHVAFEKALKIIVEKGRKDIISSAMKDGESLLHFAHTQENFVAEVKLFELFSEIFSTNENDKQVIQHAMLMVTVYNLTTGSHIMEFPLPPVTEDNENPTTPLSGDNDDTIQ